MPPSIVDRFSLTIPPYRAAEQSAEIGVARGGDTGSAATQRLTTEEAAPASVIAAGTGGGGTAVDGGDGGVFIRSFR